MADIKQVAVIVGIAVIFTAFIIVTTETFYETPRYEKVCNQTGYENDQHYIPAKPFPERPINTSCPDYYYSDPKINECTSQGGQPDYNYTKDNCPKFEKCNFCGKFFNEAIKKHGTISFIILAIIGLASIIFGVLFKIEFIGSGFMYSGIAIMFYATTRFFTMPDQNKYLKVAILFIELLIILWIGFKKLYKKK